MIDKEKCKNCNRCGECCHIRDDYKLEVSEEAILKGLAFKNFGIIYLYPFNNYTLSLSEEEKNKLKKLANNLNIKIKILPKKIVYDEKNNKFLVFDYFLDHDICPFLKNNNCLIYDQRPQVCRDFPNLQPNSQEIKEFILKNKIELPEATEKNYIKTLTKAHEFFLNHN